METTAALTTAKGTAAIASIHLTGGSAKSIIEKIFKPRSSKKPSIKPAAILVGHIIDGQQIIDEVVIGCESPNTFTINCHGNPLIVEMIMRLLKQNGAQLITAEQILATQFAQSSPNTIAAEAKLHQLKAATLQGVKIIASQTDKGLAGTIRRWLTNLDTLALSDIRNECKKILDDSKIARLIIKGVKIVIAGPPNSGKSTLLNCLSGKQKAIVSGIPGTTRDYVGSTCRIGPILAEIIDTAGLDKNLNLTAVDSEAQNRTLTLIKNSDLLLLVLDASQNPDTAKLTIPENLVNPDSLLVVFNKSDLGVAINQTHLDFDFADSVSISAKNATGIEEFSTKILKTLQVDSFGPKTAVCFTKRQKNLLQKILTAKTKSNAKHLITDMLCIDVAGA